MCNLRGSLSRSIVMLSDIFLFLHIIDDAFLAMDSLLNFVHTFIPSLHRGPRFHFDEAILRDNVGLFARNEKLQQ